MGAQLYSLAGAPGAHGPGTDGDPPVSCYGMPPAWGIRPAVAGLLVGLAIAAHSTTTFAGRKLKVEIESRPSGAEIYVDDLESEPIGVTPLKGKKLSPGVYTL